MCILWHAIPQELVWSCYWKVLYFIIFRPGQLEMLLIPNALCWSSRKCNRACALPAEVQLPLRVTCRSWQKLFAGKNFVKILVTAQTQLRSCSEQQRAFGNSNICKYNCSPSFLRSFCGMGGDCFGPRYFSEGAQLLKKNTEESPTNSHNDKKKKNT